MRGTRDCPHTDDTKLKKQMNVPININLAVAGAVTAAVMPIIGIGWTITTSDEGVGVKLSFFNGPDSFWFIIDGQIHMERYELRERKSIEDALLVAVENFVWRD